MKGSRAPEERRELVRCLECGTVYNLPRGEEEATLCPGCGGVEWVALDPDERDRDSETSS